MCAKNYDKLLRVDKVITTDTVYGFWPTLYTGHRYDNFIVGLTNVSPEISTPTLNNYTLCGQYPGVVLNGTTVSVSCQDNLSLFRYVIVQIPQTVSFVPCEIEVLVKGTRMSNNNTLSFITQADSC